MAGGLGRGEGKPKSFALFEVKYIPAAAAAVAVLHIVLSVFIKKKKKKKYLRGKGYSFCAGIHWAFKQTCMIRGVYPKHSVTNVKESK